MKAGAGSAPGPGLHFELFDAKGELRAICGGGRYDNLLMSLGGVDLPALGTDFRIPIYIVQGEEDLTTTPDLAKAYFDSLKAPRKKFILVPRTGHEPSLALLASMHALLLDEVRPLASQRR